jgi:DNA polymerase-3 subunit delta'
MTELLPWHGKQWQQLMQLSAAARLPHALLLCGPAGLGKRAFAERLAQTLLCEMRQARPRRAGPSQAEPCAKCRSCVQFAAGSRPDYCLVEPLEGKPIRIDQIRALSAFLTQTSQGGRYKIVLLADADRLNLHAANSLLKTLEEPPGQSLLLLVTALPSQLPATVRSRCQRVAFHPPAQATASAWLGARLPAAADAALLLSLAQGSPQRALRYQEAGWLQERHELFQLFAAVINGKHAPLAAAERWLQGEAEAEVSVRLEWLLGWLMDLIRLRAGGVSALANTDLRPALEQLCRVFPARRLFYLLDMAQELLNLQKTQANLQLQLEDFLLALAARAR